MDHQGSVRLIKLQFKPKLWSKAGNTDTLPTKGQPTGKRLTNQEGKTGFTGEFGE